LVALIEAITAGLRIVGIGATTQTNEAIHRPVRSALLNAIISGLVFGLLVGLFLGLLRGGAAAIQHYTLRLLLAGPPPPPPSPPSPPHPAPPGPPTPPAPPPSPTTPPAPSSCARRRRLYLHPSHAPRLLRVAASQR